MNTFEKPRKRSRWHIPVQTLAVLFVLVFVVVQLVALNRHEHHIVAVVNLQHAPQSRSGTANPAVGTTASTAPRKQLQQPQQQGASQAAAAAATTTTPIAPAEGTTAKEAPAAGDLEDAYVPARYRQRLQQLESGPHGERLLSAQYAPLRISHCSSHMPPHWAPCVKIPGVDIEYAEEVIYPPFLLRLPSFVNGNDRNIWLQMAAQRSWVPENEAKDVPDNYQLIALHPHGQNFVIRNTKYAGNPTPDNWAPSNTHCLGYNAELAQFTHTEPQVGWAKAEELFLDNGPQSAYFQHWLDHTPKVWVQGMHLLSNATQVIASPPTSRDVNALTEFNHWLADAVNMPYSNIRYGGSQPTFAKRLIYSCRCPFIHPYHFQRWREWAVGPEAGDVPMEQRKVVLYFSRNKKDAKTTNGGRRVLNEGELLPAIQELLTKRGQGEELVVFDHSKFKDYKELATYVNTKVRAIVGPHGGAMMNVQFASKDTLVVEFQHIGHINEMVWENATPLRVNYWTLIYPVASGTDVNVKVSDVTWVLGDQLGKQFPMDHFVSPHSQWKRSLVEGQPQPQPQPQQRHSAPKT